jgi:hypothetical protein
MRKTSTFKSNEAEGFRSTGLSSVVEGLPTPAVLGAVIRSTQQLLTQQAGASLDQLTTQTEGEARVTEAWHLMMLSRKWPVSLHPP